MNILCCFIFRGPEDDALKQEMSFTDRCHKREIRRLEKEISQWEILIEKSGLVEGTPAVSECVTRSV